jgi:hypothetical protein
MHTLHWLQAIFGLNTVSLDVAYYRALVTPRIDSRYYGSTVQHILYVVLQYIRERAY